MRERDECVRNEREGCERGEGMRGRGEAIREGCVRERERRVCDKEVCVR